VCACVCVCVLCIIFESYVYTISGVGALEDAPKKGCASLNHMYIQKAQLQFPPEPEATQLLYAETKLKIKLMYAEYELPPPEPAPLLELEATEGSRISLWPLPCPWSFAVSASSPPAVHACGILCIYIYTHTHMIGRYYIYI
jgi:hypothetical protein